MASTMSSLMAVSSASLIIPATLYAVMKQSDTSQNKDENVRVLSRGTAIILLIIYILYLDFQLRTHQDFFDEEQDLESEEDKEEPTLTPWAAGAALVVITVGVAVCAGE